MKKVNLFTDVPAEQREQMLRDMATKSNVEQVVRHYTDDEKQQMKDFVVENSISLKDQTEEFKAIAAEFNKAKKALSEDLNDALTRIKKGFSENEETVFLMADHDDNEMHVYDKFGEYLYSRKMRPEERQTKVIDMTAKAS